MKWVGAWNKAADGGNDLEFVWPSRWQPLIPCRRVHSEYKGSLGMDRGWPMCLLPATWCRRPTAFPARTVPACTGFYCLNNTEVKCLLSSWEQGRCVTFECNFFVIIDGRFGRVRHNASIFLPSAADAIQADALLEHAHADAFLEAAGLTRLPPPLVYLAVVGCRARIFDIAFFFQISNFKFQIQNKIIIDW